MNTFSFLYVFIICFAFSSGSFRIYNDYKTENNSVLLANAKDNIENSSKINHITKFFDPQKKIIAYANEITSECTLILLGDHVDILNFEKKFRSTTKLSENEMIEIIGKNIKIFCKNKVIITNKSNDDFKFRLNRSKRSTNKKRYQGQTQTQFVGFGSKNSNQDTKNGIAEALSQPDLSRATVSGLNGMGQAQSQSSFNDCDECSGHNYQSHVSNTNPENFSIFQPQSSFAPNTKPYNEPNMFWQSPNLQNEKNNIGPPFNGQYTNSEASNIVPSKQEQGYGIRSSVGSPLPNTHPGSGTSNIVPSYQDFGLVNEQYPNPYTSLGINNIITDKHDQKFSSGPLVDEQYPNTGKNNNMPSNQDQNNKSPNINSGFGNKILPGNLNQRHGYSFNNEQLPISANTNYSPESKNMGNTTPNQNIYPIESNLFNPSGWNYPNKMINNPNNQQIYPDGSSGFPSFPSGSGQGILSPHSSPRHNNELIYPNNNPQLLIPSSVDSQNKLTKPYSDVTNMQNERRIGNEAGIMPSTVLNEYQLPLNTNKGQSLNQLYLPPLCNFLYQTCLNALSSLREPNEFKKISGLQNNEKNPNDGKPYLGSGIPNIQPLDYSYPSYGEKNQIQSNYGQPQSMLETEAGSGVQLYRYIPSGGNANPNQIQSNYGVPQSSLGSGKFSLQQSGHVPSGGNINANQIHPNYGQQLGYIPSSGNINPNQLHSSYVQPQSSLGPVGSGVQQAGGNINPNQIQHNYGQQSGYVPSSGNINPNQLHSNYGQPQSSLRSGVQQSGGNINPNQIQHNYGQQSGYVPFSGNINPNQLHSNYGQPQSSLGSGVQQSGYIPSSGNINPNQIHPNYGEQSGYISSSGNINPNQLHSSYEQSQNSLGTGGSIGQQSSYVPSGETLNLNQIRPNYGQPQNSNVQQSGYGPYNGNVYPNQIQPEQQQGTLGSGGSRVQPLEYTQSGVDGYGNRPSSHQLDLDKGNVGNYSQSNNDNNYYRGQQFGPGSQSQNPIIGGQFGTDISSGGFVTPIDTEGGDAQSMTNLNVDGQETSASASSQGKSKSGMTQTQVSGSYAGTGMFSAQAQTSDSDKGAQSQIVSNTNGTTSTAQGRGGKGQAQSQVAYNSESGIALGEAESSGINYGTNTQLQAGIKGGLADAQSTGTGSTSSQAQIGFLPYESNNNTNQKSLFKGGGTASSQSGLYNGQSQSQLFGSYKYGISYNGAAQASSGKKLQNLPKLNLENAKLKIGQLQENNDELVKNKINVPQQPMSSLLRSQTSKENIILNNTKENIIQQNISTTQMPQSLLPQVLSRNFEEDSEYEDNDEDYEDEKDETVNTKSTQTKKEISPKQVQNIVLNLDDKHDAQIIRDSDSQLKSGQVLDAGQIIPGTDGTKIPNGFRGRVASIAGDQTEAKAIPGGQAQTQTVLLTPGAGGLTVVDKTKIKALLGQESYIGPISKPYNRFQTDMTGETGKLKPNDKNVQYFTKSSTCGYFSFSCNYVNGAKSGAKICKPNPPPIPCQRNNE